jgi:hypothetical protein
VWKSGGSIFTDYESRVMKGLILRQEDRGDQADKHPVGYPGGRVLRTWMIQCRGKYPLKIGGVNSVSLDEARETAKLLRTGDEQAIVRAYLTDTEYTEEACNSGGEARDIFRQCSLAQIEQLIESKKTILEDRSPWNERDRWLARRRVKDLETILKGLSVFTKREGLKIRKSRPHVIADRARSRRAA